MTSSRSERTVPRRDAPAGVPSGHVAPEVARVQVALLTGRSDPADARPSPSQAALLDALAMPGVTIVRTNFPWTSAAAEDGGTSPPAPAVAAAVPLWRASLRNAAHYVGSRRAGWAERHRPVLEAWVSRTELTVLLCGSCGLELLANLSAQPATLERLHVFAWGPVARRLPRVASLESVQGRTDRLSRCWIARERIDHVVESGHMDYLADAHVIDLARRFVVRVRDGGSPDGTAPCA